MSKAKLTHKQQKMLDYLSDGQAHIVKGDDEVIVICELAVLGFVKPYVIATSGQLPAKKGKG